MSIKSILCGHLPTTKSVKYHPIQNITLSPSSNWSRAEILYKNEELYCDKNDCPINQDIQKNQTIYTIGNIPNKEFNITMTDTSNYKIALLVNNKMVMENLYLFYVEIKIYLKSDCTSTDFIKIINSSIDDN